MATKDDDYKFPDELDQEKAKGKTDDELDISIEGDDDEVKIEVKDDTPTEDRHIEPLSDDVKKELETVDESKDYSHNVKTKFKQYKKAWHDERRAKEAAYREQQEALQIAQNILEENKKAAEGDVSGSALDQLSGGWSAVRSLATVAPLASSRWTGSSSTVFLMTRASLRCS